MSDKVTLFYNPMSRARVAHWMLEEVGADYELIFVDWNKDKPKELLEANAMGKLPTILHRSIAISESAAVCAYLGDAFPKAGLAPAVTSPDRGPYYRWLFFAASCIETAFADHTNPRIKPIPKTALGYGSYEDTMANIERAISSGYVAGNRFTAADLYLSSQLWWGLISKSMKATPAVEKYLQLCTDRPAYKRANEMAEKFKA
jgi:glutathione S-transferase